MYHESCCRYDHCIMESGTALLILGTILVLAGLSGTLLPGVLVAVLLFD